MSEQLVRCFYSAPPLGVGYCVAKPQLTLMQCQLTRDLALMQHLNGAYAAPAT